MKSANLRDLDSFGEVAAEDDEVLLNYFLSIDTVGRVKEGGAFLVVGRKGSGKKLRLFAISPKVMIEIGHERSIFETTHGMYMLLELTAERTR